MKKLHFVKPNNLNQLHDELLAAHPELRKVSPGQDGRFVALPDNLCVEGNMNEVWLTVPDAADETAIAAVVAAHDPTIPRPPTSREVVTQRIAELLTIPRSDWTVAQQRELLQLVAQEQIQ